MRSEKFLALSKVFFLALTLTSCVQQKVTQVVGRATYVDGSPIVGGEVVFTQLLGRPFSMPKPEKIATVVTDQRGEFSVKLRNVDRNADIDVELLPKKCNWLGNSYIMQLKELGEGIRLESKRDQQKTCGP